MLKDRKSLLAFCKENGFEGEETLEAIKSWWGESGIEATDEDGKPLDGEFLESVWKVQPKSVVVAAKSKTVGAGADISEKGGGMHWTPAASRRKAARKAYNQKAQHERPGARRAKNGGIAFGDADEAEAFGAWSRSALCGIYGIDSWEDKTYDQDICRKANITTSNSSGGATIPEDFQATMINLKEAYGVARQVVGTTPMTRDTLTLPRRTGGVTVYAPGEAASITESNPTVDNVTLTARKLACYTEVSSELLNDSAIDFGNFVADEMAYAFAEKEDQMFFNGDGTSTYFHVNGVRNALKSLSGTIANIAGLYVGTGNAYSELVINDFVKLLGLAPQYIDSRSPYWICHKRFYYETMRPLAIAKSGTTATEVVNGIPRMVFEGFPVLFTPVMPRVEANSQVCALFGAYGEGAKIGEVRGSMSIATSDQYKFQSDVISFRALERIAMSVHDVGNASATEASRVPGPIVGLITAAA